MSAAQKAEDRRWPIPGQRRRADRKESDMAYATAVIRKFAVKRETQDAMIAVVDALYVLK